MDAELNLPPDKYSHSLQILLGDEVAKGAYDEAVIKLRALRSSGDFEDYWNFHRAEEFKRHHRSRFPYYPRLEVVK